MPMKVTVCFEKVKVLVPCGDGEILVRELIEKAITRYKKAIGKSTDYWVSVHTIRTVSEDSILDPDDTLLDVVDDREQLIADFEEQGGPRVSANGDGQSASSAGTASPDIFQTDLTNHTKLHDHNRGYSFDSGNDVIVTSTDIHAGSGLTVRRGSEPNLNVLDDHNVGGLTNGVAGHGQDEQENNNNINQNNEDHKPIIKGGGPARAEKEKTPPFSRFARDSWRQSLGNQPNMYKWLEAQERQEDQYKSVERQGPVGGATSPEQSGEVTLDDPAAAVGHKRTLPPLPPGARAHHREVGILIALKNDGTPLGIHVVPDFGEDGRETGLMVQGIEPGGRIDQDGRLKVHDRIIEINSQDLHNMTFPKAQEIFRNAMKTDVVNLKIVKHSIPALPKKPPPAVLPKPRGHSPVKPSPLTLPPQSLDIESPQSSPDQTSTPMDQSETVTNSNNQSKHPSSSAKTNKPIITSSPIKPASPVKKAPPPPPTRHPKTSLSANENSDNNNTKSKNSVETGYLTKSPPSSNPGTLTKSSSNGTLTKNRELIIAPTNTKKIGKRVVVELVKGDHGLGFSITTRDNTSGGPSPIYIKNIQPQGAAVTDGRLKAGDRLLEVNGAEMTDVTQTEAVTILRNCPRGSPVTIVVSRQVTEEVDEMFKVPRELPISNQDKGHDFETDLDPRLFQPAEKAGDDGTLAIMKNKELIEFDIPLNDTGSAGLGVSVKGKTLTTEEGTRDLGIFVKAVMQGGAASKDGRLQVNDQLLEVNQSSLIQRSNMEAMDILRNAMQEEGLIPGSINIKVARRIGAPSPSPFSSPGSPDGEFFGDVGPLSKKEENNNNNFSLGKSDHVTDAGFSESPERTKNGNIANMSNFKSPNLFLDRVMAGNGLRNMSYTRATHDSYVESPEPRRSKNIINLSKQRPRPHSTIGIERGPSPNSSSDEDNHKEPAWLKGPDWTKHASQTSEESELSPTGDGFARDAFGRQSMSEKRKGHGDPRSSEIYQKVKGLKELNKGDASRYKHSKSRSYDDTNRRRVYELQDRLIISDYPKERHVSSNHPEDRPRGSKYQIERCTSFKYPEKKKISSKYFEEKPVSPNYPEETQLTFKYPEDTQLSSSYNESRHQSSNYEKDRPRAYDYDYTDSPKLRDSPYKPSDSYEHIESAYQSVAKRAASFHVTGLQKSIQQSGSYGRLVRAGSAESLLSRSNSNVHSPYHSRANIRGPGPPSNLKRFSSLENLTTMQDADADMSASFDDDDASPPSRMGRRRGGNESFRCAVDRSYDPVPHLDMAPQTSDEKAPPNNMRRSQSVEEEGSEGGSGGRDPSNSARSSVSDTAFNDDPWGKKKGNKKQKEARRSGGLLKGFFKFGRGRKTPVDDIGKGDNPPTDPGNHGNKDNIDIQDAGEHRQHIEQQEILWKQAQIQQERNEAEFRRLQEQHMLDGQKQRQQVSNQQSYNPFPLQDPEPHSMGHSAPVVGHRDRDVNNPDQSGLTRAEKIQQLRADHQRRHQARQGQYPQEDKEEEYEKMIQEDEKKKYGQSAIPSNLEGSQGQNQGRGSRPSSRNQAERPNSRGVGGSVGEFGGLGTSNYQDYSQLPPQPGNRHISDSNITKYGYHRPPSRGALVSDNSHPSNFYQPQSNLQQQQSNFNPHNQQQHSGIARGPTPNYERQFQHQGIPRGIPPTNEHDRNPNFQSKSSGNINISNSSHLNFHPAHRGPTPPNVNQTGGEKWYYSEDGDQRQNQKNVNQSNNVTKNRDHVTKQEVMPPSGQGGGSHFGNSAFAYRDPVYTAMAGKRPVKTLSTQPNSAKV